MRLILCKKFAFKENQTIQFFCVKSLLSNKIKQISNRPYNLIFLSGLEEAMKNQARRNGIRFIQHPIENHKMIVLSLPQAYKMRVKLYLPMSLISDGTSTSFDCISSV